MGWPVCQLAVSLTIQVLQYLLLGKGELLCHSLQLLGKDRVMRPLSPCHLTAPHPLPSAAFSRDAPHSSVVILKMPSVHSCTTATLQQGAVRGLIEWGALSNPQVPALFCLAWGWCSCRLAVARGSLSTYLRDIGDQAPEAEQNLRHSLHTRAYLLMHVLVGDKGTDHTSPAGMGEDTGACWMPAGTLGLSPRLPPAPSAPHSSTRVVSSRKAMRVPRSQAVALCSVFTRPPQRRRQQQKHRPAMGTTSR